MRLAAHIREDAMRLLRTRRGVWCASARLARKDVWVGFSVDDRLNGQLHVRVCPLPGLMVTLSWYADGWHGAWGLMD